MKHSNWLINSHLSAQIMKKTKKKYIQYSNFSLLDIVAFVKALQESESKSEDKDEEMALDWFCFCIHDAIVLNQYPNLFYYYFEFVVFIIFSISFIVGKGLLLEI